MELENISIVIPAYNSLDLLKRYLPSVFDACKRYSLSKTELIIVDNASTDGTVEYIKSNFPDIKLIVHQVNEGFSVSANDGVFAAKNRIVVLLSTDVEVKEDFLQFILPYFVADDVFAIRPGLDSDADDLKRPMIGGRG